MTPPKQLADVLARLPDILSSHIARFGSSGRTYEALILIKQFPSMLADERREAFLEAARLCCLWCRDGYQRADDEHLNRSGIGNIGRCRANNIYSKLAEQPKEKK